MHFFKDKEGHIKIWQPPNMLLYGWLVFKILSMLIDMSRLKTGFSNLSTAFLFAWAFLELTQGVNYFRRILGLVVLVALVIGYFK